jgi:SAM-dependent methyltransferase
MAEAAFLSRAYRHYFTNEPSLLREDFAGTAAVASAWVEMGPDHQAMAVEAHGPTLRRAQRTAEKELGDAVQDLHLVEADVLSVEGPKVDVTCALNFSTFIYHHRGDLKRYFQSARRGLKRNGLLVVDAYGGPGAMRVGTQTRSIPPETEQPGVTYHWEQRSFDPVTHRAECRIHFDLADGRRLESAFIYRWRLWTLAELIEVMLETGFKTAEAWCDRIDPASGMSDGRYRRVRRMPAREDWVAYVVGAR